MKSKYVFITFILSINICYSQEDNGFLNRSNGCADFFFLYSTGNVFYDICDYQDYTLVFEDNFDGDTLDEKKWQLRLWGEGSFDGAQEYNKLANAVVSNGTLKIIAKREYLYTRAIGWRPDDDILPDGYPNLRNFFFTSSNLWTKKQFLYGIFEARIKIPKGRGYLPSFWLFGGNKWNEIDIFEFWNIPGDGEYNSTLSASTINTNVHYDYDGDGVTNSCSAKYRGDDFSNDFHIYTLAWGKNKISWYVDGEIIREYHSNYIRTDIFLNPVECVFSPISQYLRRFVYPREPMCLIVDLAIDNGSDAPDLNTTIPAEMEIDWVRCYQRIEDYDVVINDMSDFHFDDYYANSITGRNVTIDCDFTVDSSRFLDIVGKNEIVLKPGFEAKMGSIVNASIIEEIENRSYTNRQDSSPFEVRPSKVFEEKNNNIHIAPNPTSETISVNSIGTGDYCVSIFNIKGEKVMEKLFEDADEMRIDVSNLPTGIYFVKIITKNNEVLLVKKIIVK